MLSEHPLPNLMLPWKPIVKRMCLEQWITRNYALNKKYVLNSECALNRKSLGIERGAIYRVRYPAIGGAKIAKIAMEEYTIESVIRGHHIYIKSIWHCILGEQLTLEREDGNRQQTSRSLASTLTPQ